jgi:hypothetical protein
VAVHIQTAANWMVQIAHPTPLHHRYVLEIPGGPRLGLMQDGIPTDHLEGGTKRNFLSRLFEQQLHLDKAKARHGMVNGYGEQLVGFPNQTLSSSFL